MATLESLDPAQRTAVLEHASRLKHDLGKYIAFQTRWLGPDASALDRQQALEADLLATRRGPEGTVSAVEVWQQARGGLFGTDALRDGLTVDLSDDAIVAHLDAQMAQVAGVVRALQQGPPDEDTVQRGCELALAVADSCKQLVLAARNGERLG